jgi:hypothetical protein
LKRWAVQDGTLTLRHSMQNAAALRLLKVARGGWAASVGEGVLVVSFDGSTVALRLDLGRNIDAIDVSPDLRYVAAGVNGELVVVDLLRDALATLTTGSPVVQQVSFLDATSLAFTEPTALRVLQVGRLDYIPYRAVPEPRNRATF